MLKAGSAFHLHSCDGIKGGIRVIKVRGAYHFTKSLNPPPLQHNSAISWGKRSLKQFMSV